MWGIVLRRDGTRTQGLACSTVTISAGRVRCNCRRIIVSASTTLRVLAAHQPSGGARAVLTRQAIGTGALVFQDSGVLPGVVVAANVSFGLRCVSAQARGGTSTPEAAGDADLVGLGDLRQRLAISALRRYNATRVSLARRARSIPTSS
jgi:ABC-type taurine transport system ATPase subunit